MKSAGLTPELTVYKTKMSSFSCNRSSRHRHGLDHDSSCSTQSTERHSNQYGHTVLPGFAPGSGIDFCSTLYVSTPCFPIRTTPSLALRRFLLQSATSESAKSLKESTENGQSYHDNEGKMRKYSMILINTPYRTSVGHVVVGLASLDGRCKSVESNSVAAEGAFPHDATLNNSARCSTIQKHTLRVSDRFQTRIWRVVRALLYYP